MTEKTAAQMKALCGWKEIAKHLGVSVSTAYRLRELDELPVKRIGGHVRTTVGLIDEWHRRRILE